MSFIPDEKENVEVPSTKIQTIDTFMLHEIIFRINPQDENDLKAELHWSEGYKENEEYIPVESKLTIFGSEVFNSQAEDIIQPGDTCYMALQRLFWGLLLKQGEITEGTVNKI